MSHPKLIVCATAFALAAPAWSEVVLETDDDRATLTGAWTTSTAAPGYYGVDFATAVVGGAADTARFFSPKAITSTGTWCAQARWTQGSNRSAAARYELYDGTTLRGSVTVDQRINGGAWRTLSCVPLTAGRTAEVRLLDTSGTAGTLVVADGVRWVWEENSAQSLCVNVAGGQAAGGGTYVAQGLAIPANGTCKPWSGFMKTGTNVIGFTAGSACTSSDGQTLTASLSTTNPSFFGTSPVTDHIRLCLGASCPAGVTQIAVSTYFGSSAPARVTCTAAMLQLPAAHN